MGYGTVKCKCCGRTPKSTTLIAIGSILFCQRCLSIVRIKATGRIGEYYYNVGRRCFISFRHKDGLHIQEYSLKELIIGRRKAS